MTSKEQLRQAAEIELHTVNKVLEPVGITAEAFEMPGPYDRAKADVESNDEMQKAFVIRGGTSAIGAYDKLQIMSTAHTIHEANRFRRDYNIAIASHKKLMLGVYRTMYQRKKKLEAALEG